MGFRKTGILVILVVTLLFTGGVIPVKADIPVHVNPEEAAVVYDGVTLLERYGYAADQVLAKNTLILDLLLENTEIAHIPDDLKDSAGKYYLASRKLSVYITYIERDIDLVQELVREARVNEALELIKQAKNTILAAREELGIMETNAWEAGTWWRADKARKGSALAIMWGNLLAKLENLKALLDYYEQLLTIAESETGAIIDDDILTATNLTLYVEPMTAYVGDIITIYGWLNGEDGPLDSRSITVLLDGVPATNFTTGNDGRYEGTLQLPYDYVSKKTLKAVYVPKEGDVGVYMGCGTPVLEVETLYYITSLELIAPEQVYPGAEFELKGIFNYESGNIAENRRINLYCDGVLLADEVVGAEFDFIINIPDDAIKGIKRYTVYVTNQLRYAGATSTAQIEVITVKPIVTLDVKGFAFLPAVFDVKGEVSSNNGYIEGAEVKAILGEWSASTRTGSDGSFSLEIETALNLSLVGAQQLRVEITPSEPWCSKTTVYQQVMVINPVNIAGLFLIALSSLVLVIRAIVRNKKRPHLKPRGALWD